MTDAAKETMFSVLEKYGFPVVVSLALGFFLREDVVKPLVSEHAAFLRSISETQREIAKAVSEQTRLLYAMQPRAEKPADERN